MILIYLHALLFLIRKCFIIILHGYKYTYIIIYTIVLSYHYTHQYTSRPVDQNRLDTSVYQRTSTSRPEDHRPIHSRHQKIPWSIYKYKNKLLKMI